MKKQSSAFLTVINDHIYRINNTTVLFEFVGFYNIIR